MGAANLPADDTHGYADALPTARGHAPPLPATVGPPLPPPTHLSARHPIRTPNVSDHHPSAKFRQDLQLALTYLATDPDLDPGPEAEAAEEGGDASGCPGEAQDGPGASRGICGEAAGGAEHSGFRVPLPA